MPTRFAVSTRSLRRLASCRPGLGRRVDVCSVLFLILAAQFATAQFATAQSWRTDPAWYDGKAEWALYEASREIYGVPRSYEATIFTNKQHQDPETTTKSGGGGGFEVFKHNVSEMVPTENYTYRFLTTSFIKTDSLQPYKIVASTQEDCGATFKQFTVVDGHVHVLNSCYFPGTGVEQESYRRPGNPANFTFHDALTLTLRDYPFDAATKPERMVKLVPDQTNPRPTSARPEEATVSYQGEETLTVPYGALRTHHLRVTHDNSGGATTSDYWFAADPAMRHVLVKYQGPFGVQYQLKALDWWAYWDTSAPQPKGR